MSKYTTEVRFICETKAGLVESADRLSVDEIIERSRASIFDFNYPIFDDEYRKTLEKKILKHFYTREIGFETVGLWILKLDTKLNEIMPYYNQLYESAKLEFNPLYDVDYTRDYKGKGNSVKDGNGRSDNDLKTHSVGNVNDDNINKYSDTPQGGLQGVESGTYLTTATINNNVNKSDTVVENTGNVKNMYNENNTNENEYREAIKGKMGGTDFSTLLKRYRETFLNIDMKVIGELEELFFQLW